MFPSAFATDVEMTEGGAVTVCRGLLSKMGGAHATGTDVTPGEWGQVHGVQNVGWYRFRLGVFEGLLFPLAGNWGVVPLGDGTYQFHPEAAVPRH